MRLLFVHSDHLEFEARREAGPDDRAETEGVPMQGRMEECLTVFVGVERDDEADTASVVDDGVAELRDVAGQLDTDRVVLYPYPHLSDDPADPAVAKTVMGGLEGVLVEDGYGVLRAPAGWDKSFEVACKGHPLAQLSRQVRPERPDEDGSDREPSDWRVVWPDGTSEDALAAKTAVSAQLRSLVAAEVEGTAASQSVQPRHVELLQETALAGEDDLSDVGNLRWYPRGKLVRDALMAYVDDLAVEYGGVPVETPVMYDLGVRAVSEHAGTFGERQYRFESGDRPMVLRPAACLGHVSVMRDMHVAESDLPLALYEMSTYSFRREQRGAASGLERLRTFTLPNMHTATADVDDAREELLAQADLALSAGADIGLDYVPVLRVTRAFYEDDVDWVERAVARFDRPTLLEVVPERRRYWSAKVDFATVDALGRPVEHPTVQIDVESAERFDVSYTDGDASHHPPILHCSPSGGIERLVATLLEQAATMDRPRLPTWLSPTQVRFVPVTDDHVARCDDLVDDLTAANVRADVDERAETVGKRVARAETDWVPYYAVVGDRELAGTPLGVTVRETGREVELDPDELRERVVAETEGYPRPRRYLPRHVSDHPSFTGR